MHLSHDLLRACFKKLPEKIRLVIYLKYWQEETEKSISKILKISIEEVEKCLCEGTKILKADPLLYGLNSKLG